MSLPILAKNYIQWVIQHPKRVVLVAFILVIAAASGGQFLKFTTDYRIFFGKTNPQLQAFDALEQTYSKNENVIIVLAPKNNDVFTPKTLALIEDITKQAWQTPYSSRVDSLSNFQHTEADGDDLIVADLYRGGAELNKAEISRVREIALKEPLLVKSLVSEKGHIAGINISIQLPGINQTTETPEVVAFIRKLVDQYAVQNPDIDFYTTGMVMMNNAFPEASQDDMKSLVPLSFLLILISLTILLRGLSGTFATFWVVICTILATMGISGWLGFPLSPPTATTPIIVLTLAIADSVHILTSFYQTLRSGNTDKAAAMIKAMRINMQPVFLTSLTTAVGFLTMNFSDVPPFGQLGNMVAIGVMTAFVLSVSLLPAMMMLLPVKTDAKEHNKVRIEKLADFVLRHRRRLFWGVGLIAVFCLTLIPRNELNDVFVNYFDESVEFRRHTDFVTENLNGIYQIHYSLQTGQAEGITDPTYLKDIENFANWYRQQPETTHVNVLTDIMKRLNKNMHGDDSTWYKLPERRDLAAQYLLLYEMSLPYGLDLNNQINVDKSATRMVVSLETMSTKKLLDLERRAEEWLQGNTTSFKTLATGPSIMFAHIGKRNINSMLLASALALVLVSTILIFALRSVKIGLISLAPNLLPAAIAFGLWGLFVGQIGLSLSIVISMTLGIVVDDTVHFLSKYLRARREEGLDAANAIRYAFNTVGVALITTSLVLTAGFAVLAFSHFELNSGMGIMTSIIIAIALLTDFLFLPALLLLLEKKNEAEQNNTVSVAADTAT